MAKHKQSAYPRQHTHTLRWILVRGLVLECRQHKCHSLTVNLHIFKGTFNNRLVDIWCSCGSCVTVLL